jgi:hypothetical protein
MVIGVGEFAMRDKSFNFLLTLCFQVIEHGNGMLVIFIEIESNEAGVHFLDVPPTIHC